ncbi:MAG: cellulase family glycosylhydrolase [Sphingomonadales bacterium]
MAGQLRIDGTEFRDAMGRHVLLRGVNFGGDCKVPATPDGRTHLPSDFADHRTVSFVGRPAPLDEIDSHLARLAHWGFNCLRLLTTWEAVAHAGPGQHDEAYLAYFAEVCRRAGAHGFHVFIDFHQDVWSRMSGGDGAPGWTFAAAGLDFSRFDAADAAIVMQHRYDGAVGGEQASYPRMVWGSNYRRPAAAIMWTLFFGGEAFVPAATHDGCNIGRWLQDQYLDAMRAVAQRVADLPHVIGFDTLNEPGSGWIGRRLDARQGLIRGPAWTPLDGLALAAGHTRTLPMVEGGETVMNPDGVSIWLPGHADPFRAAGAWGLDGDGQPAALEPDFFRQVGGRAIDLEQDLMRPFYHRVADTIRAVRPDWLLFAEADPFSPGHGFPAPMPANTVNASHWYDLAALVTKRFDAARHIDVRTRTPLVGRAAIESAYVAGLAERKAFGDALPGGAPTLIGECGIPFDMNDRAAFRAWAQGDHSDAPWQAQILAQELMYNALDTLLLSSTQWNYTASNRNDAAIGDGWNQEDLSIWSADQVSDAADPDAGGRGVAGFCRPYVQAAQGRLLHQRFDRASGDFEAVIAIDPAIAAPTEIHVPALHYRTGFSLTAQPGVRSETDGQRLRLWADTAGELHLRISRR